MSFLKNSMNILPYEPLGPMTAGLDSSMLPQDMKPSSSTNLWNDVPIRMKSTVSDAGRAQLLYGWLRITGMDQMNEIKGCW